MEHYAWLIPALPLGAALWISVGYLFGGNRGEAGEKQTAWVAQGAAGLSLLLALSLALQALWQGAPGQLQVAEWLRSGNLVLNIGFTPDPLGLAMTNLVAFIGLLTLRFSVNYLHREAGFQRFLLVLCLFVAAMELIVMAGSAALAQVGLMFVWCGLGWFQLAAWHLALHALWRAYQFLHAPALMHLISRAARPVPPWLAQLQRLRTAALHRFWLDSAADWLLVHPTRADRPGGSHPGHA